MARLAANRAPLSVRSRKVSANRRRFLGGVVSVLLVTGVLVVVASPASAGVPGAPGTPVVVAIPGGIGLRWSAPADVGSPPLTRYRVEVNRGSGWSVATSVATPVSIVGGYNFHCALLDNGTVKCWGYGVSGQLGQGDQLTRGDGPGEMGDNLPTVNLGTGRTAVALDAGSRFVCALLDNGAVKCWGANYYGALGLGDTAPRGDGPGEMGDNLPTVNLGTGRTAVALAVNWFSVCAILDNGSVKCWGAGGYLGLGDNTTRGDGPGEMGDNLPTVDLGTGRTAIAISAGVDQTCAILDNGVLKCWGWNFHGELGLGDTEDRGDEPGEMGDHLPVIRLGAGRKAVALSAGEYHSCALLDNATVKCWGWNASGGLGLGDSTFRGDDPNEMGDHLPAVSLGTGRSAVAVDSRGTQACAVLDNASLKCWGSNFYGQLGLGDTANRGDGPGEMGDSLPAVSLGTGRSVSGFAAGLEHACALLDNGSVKCWGNNESGRLGLGDTVNRGDGPGEMGDSLPAVNLGTGRSGAPSRAATVRLAPGTYQVRVVAVNSLGASVASGASAAVVVPSSLSIGKASVVEGANGSRALKFTASLSAPSPVQVTAHYATSNGTAHAGSDFTSSSGDISIAAGETSAQVSVPVTGDAAGEQTETFTVTLSSIVGAARGRRTATGKILNDDPMTGRKITIGDAAVEEGVSGTRDVRVTIALSAPSATATTVHWATSNLGAVAPGDYVTDSGTATIAANARATAIRVTVKGDAATETDERLHVTISNPTAGTTIGRDLGTITILNDD